jgi:1,4-alpha-glucan branching enzyme
MAKTHRLFNSSNAQLLHEHFADKVIIFKRADLIFAFNFHPYRSFTDYRFDAPSGEYRMLLDCDALKYGGHGRLQPEQKHFTIVDDSEARSQHMLSLYLPARSAFVLCPATEDPQP